MQWMEQQFEVLRRTTEAIKKETENLGAILAAETRKEISEIETQKSMVRIIGEKNISAINDEIVRGRERTAAETGKYRKEKIAAGNKLLFANLGYVDVMMSKKLAPEAKVYYSGQEGVLGALLKEILEA